MAELSEHLGWLGTAVVAGWLLNLAMIPGVVNSRRPAVSALAWVLALLFVPLIAAMFYMTVGQTRLRRRVKRRRRVDVELVPGLIDVKGKHGHLAASPTALDDLPRTSRNLITQAAAMHSHPLTRGNDVELLVDGEQTFPRLLSSLLSAEHHIHMIYYIFEPDETGAQIRDVLISRAREGVEVRVLVDAVGSWMTGTGFFDELEAVGGVVHQFMPARWAGRRLDINFRNHRKIVVVDGVEGYTGGLNIGNEYSGIQRATAWHDIHVRIVGPAAHSLQETFAHDWFFASGEDIASDRYFPAPGTPGHCPVQIVASGPDLEWPALHELVFTAMALAQRRLYIMTPYFVPTAPILSALVAAAHRQVDVRLVLPLATDQFLVDWASRSYYRELLEAGVRIYHYDDRMLHAKVMSVDGEVATVGTANVDVRSFELNFEVTAFVHSAAFVRSLDRVIEDDLDKSREVTLAAFRRRPALQKLAQNAARLLSPLL